MLSKDRSPINYCYYPGDHSFSIVATLNAIIIQSEITSLNARQQELILSLARIVESFDWNINQLKMPDNSQIAPPTDIHFSPN